MAIFCKNCGRKISTGSICGECLSVGKKVGRSISRTKQLGSTSVAAINDEIFFNISVTRLIVLSIATLGIYDLYWFYRNWWYIEDSQNKKISSLGRAIFTLIFCYGLFSEIAQKAISKGYKKIYPGWLAFLYIVVAIISKGLDKIDSSQIAESDQLTIGLVAIFILFINIIPLYIVQKAINFINEKNGSPINKKFATGEVIFIIISIGIVIALTFI